ncbi:MAG: hypothetical protein FE048_04310 [Thermoplasmata archaeon]|nr:MAG: hypothetical protein FE048_04310 [Thermoplasmata archaeon]
MLSVKISALLALFVFFFPLTNACFVSSELEVEVEDVPPLTPLKTVSVDANITFRWGFGAIFLFPLTLYVEIKDVPEWVYITLSEASFTVAPEKIFEGFFGGEKRKTISITLTPHKEIEAYVDSRFKLHVYTNGSFLIRGSEDEESVSIRQDFQNKGIIASLSPSTIKVKEGESKSCYLNLTNECNGDVTVTFEVENITDNWRISFSPQQIIIPSSYSGINKKTVVVTFRGKGSEEGLLKIQYSPSANPEWGKSEVYVPLLLESTEKGGIGGIIGIIAVIIFLLFIAFLWKKRKI